MARQTTWVVNGNGSINSLSTDQVILHMLTFFSKSTFSKKIFQEYYQRGPDLGPNCLQRLTADDTSR